MKIVYIDIDVCLLCTLLLLLIFPNRTVSGKKRNTLFRLNLEVTNNELYYLLLPSSMILKQNNIQIIQAFFVKLHVCFLTIKCFSLMYLLFLHYLGVSGLGFFPCCNCNLLDSCKVFPAMHLICCFLRMLISDLLECSVNTVSSV